ncbi:MAG: cell envelope integrity protein TolA [Pseudomonadales bacterium]|nr:cell envelope integrity protein TolA [Pseudomonadales bacterium]
MSEALALPPPPGRWARIGMPVLLAVLVHLLAALALTEFWQGDRTARRPERIDAIEARLVTLERQAPKPAPRAQPKPTPRPTPPAPDKAAEKPAQKPLPTEPEPARPEPEPARQNAPPAEAKPVEPEREAAADPTDGRWREAVTDSFESALEQEAAQIADARADQMTSSYVGDIVARIERNWSRPPSARNGMEAELLIGLVPTGEVVSVSVVRGSGNAAFDRSAEVAVRQAAPFKVPDDPVLFERSFRALRILFKPEDLRN